MPPEDAVRLRHMVDAAQEAQRFVEGRRRADLDADRMLVHALVRCIEIIGEAASRVSPATQGRRAEIPWTDIVGMRNRLIHAYFDVDLDRVWDTVAADLPPLVRQLRSVLESPAGR